MSDVKELIAVINAVKATSKIDQWHFDKVIEQILKTDPSDNLKISQILHEPEKYSISLFDKIAEHLETVIKNFTPHGPAPYQEQQKEDQKASENFISFIEQNYPSSAPKASY